MKSGRPAAWRAAQASSEPNHRSPHPERSTGAAADREQASTFYVRATARELLGKVAQFVTALIYIRYVLAWVIGQRTTSR